MHEYSVQPQSHGISLVHPPLEARNPTRKREAEYVLLMASSAFQEPRIDGLPSSTPSSVTLETLWLDLTVEVPKQWFVDVLYPFLQTLPNIRKVHIRAVAQISALNDTSTEQPSLLLAHELATLVRRLVLDQGTLETLLLLYTPCVSPAPFKGFDAYEAALPCGWAKHVLFHRVDVKRYRNASAVVTCRNGTEVDRRAFMREGVQEMQEGQKRGGATVAGRGATSETSKTVGEMQGVPRTGEA